MIGRYNMRRNYCEFRFAPAKVRPKMEAHELMDALLSEAITDEQRMLIVDSIWDAAMVPIRYRHETLASRLEIDETKRLEEVKKSNPLEKLIGIGVDLEGKRRMAEAFLGNFTEIMTGTLARRSPPSNPHWFHDLQNGTWQTLLDQRFLEIAKEFIDELNRHEPRTDGKGPISPWPRTRAQEGE